MELRCEDGRPVNKKMTIREIADKYSVPYHIVYEASYKVTPISTELKDRDWPEREMVREIYRIACERIKFHRQAMDKSIMIKERMEGSW